MVTEPWSLNTYLQQRSELIEAALNEYLPVVDCPPARLHESMRYSVFAGGKRLRPILLLAACEAVGGDPVKALPAACALEMVHSYSLVHDDLPAMDDDDLRRGQPTNHQVFGEATAILAGDALLTEAFALLSNAETCARMPPARACEIVQILARSSGSTGMVGGQLVDMESEDQRIDLATLEYIHTRKTGALIRAAVEMGAVIGEASTEQRQALCRYAEAAGLAFQVADDILDIVADQAELGKKIGSDQDRGKATFPSLIGLEQARRRAAALKQQALAEIDQLDDSAQALREIAIYIVDRPN
jgi:geranylgeranyl diphosphate synthase type II